MGNRSVVGLVLAVVVACGDGESPRADGPASADAGPSDGGAPPAPVAATSADELCIGGRGIWCRDDVGWGWRGKPELFAAPIERFVTLWEPGSSKVFLVVLENGDAYLLRDGALQPFDLGTKERLVSLSTDALYAPDEWAAVTVSGKLVRGSLLGGRTCGTTVRFARTAYRTGLLAQQADRMIGPKSDGSGSYALSTPPDTRAHGSAGCGISLSLVLVDAHRVDAQKNLCVAD